MQKDCDYEAKANADYGGNRDVLQKLRKYVPEGYLQEGSHVPVWGKGCWYQDADGKEYLDFSSGIFTNTFGHGCDRLIKVSADQAALLANIHGRHSVAELRFYERLFLRLPASDYRAIPYNDGGYTIDRGLTDIINYYGKRRIGIGAYRGGFHGKTQAGKLLINETQKAALFDNFQIEFPNCYRCPWKKQKESCGMVCVEAACRILREKKAGALIFEPVQGAEIIIPPKRYWEKIQDFCREQGILLFADEVLTGGGRMGIYLASSYFGIVPDMIAITKGLANGKPLSVLLEREFITKNCFAIRPMERSSTFAAHPEALAVAAEVLDMLEQGRVLQNVQICAEVMKQGLAELEDCFDVIGEIRSIGLMAAVEFVKNRESKVPFREMGDAVTKRCKDNGLEVIGNGHIIRLAPPLVISREELSEGLKRLEQSIKHVIFEDFGRRI